MKHGLVLLLAAIAIWAAGLRPANAQGSSYGIISSQLLPAQANRAADLGIGWVMLDFTWNTMEANCTIATRPACRQWSVWHDQVARARQNGLQVLAEVGGTPGWANGGKTPAWIPADLQTWYDFLFAVVSEFKGDIKYWKFWNEPDLGQFLQPGGKAFWISYDAIARTAHSAIKAADPTAMIVGPDLSSNALFQRPETFRQIVNGYEWMFDVISVHYYRERDRIALGQRLDRTIEPYISVSKPVWITEIGEDSERVGPEGQETFYREALYEYSERRDWVSNIFFYHLFGDPGYNLTSGDALEEQKPAYVAYREWVRSGATAGFLPRLTPERSSRSRWAAWMAAAWRIVTRPVTILVS